MMEFALPLQCFEIVLAPPMDIPAWELKREVRLWILNNMPHVEYSNLHGVHAPIEGEFVSPVLEGDEEIIIEFKLRFV